MRLRNWSAPNGLRWVLWMLLFAGTLVASPAGRAAPGPSFQVWVRDAMTGIGVSHASATQIDKSTGRAGAALKAQTSGRLSLTAPSPDVLLSIQAEGYGSMRIPAAPDPASAVTTVWLDPVARPEVLRPESLQAARKPDTALLHGHVIDVATGRPVAGALVESQRDGQQVISDEHGYFRIDAPGGRPLEPTDIPDFTDLVVSHKGYRSVRLHDVALIAEDFHFIVDLERGAGETVIDKRPRLFPLGLESDPGFDPSAPASEVPQPAAPDSAKAQEAFATSLAASGAEPGVTTAAFEATAGGLMLVNPPDQILVSGYGWFPLEVYVARGLCSEWIASWPDHSLRAGSIPYRSYGAWYQINRGSICNTTSCQVFRNDYNSRCDSAAQVTTGMLLQLDGAVSRSEYSAENNGCNGCSYTAMGHPSAGWSCMTDNHHRHVTRCFGHGRGMCQWGTEAWSEGGYRWNWMVDRYYNAFGAGTGNRRQYLTTPFSIPAASTNVTSVARGGSFTINATLRSYADWSQPRLMLGASILGPSTLSDPPRDKKVTAYARSGYSTAYRDTAVSRGFVVSSAARTGYYDLLVAVWFDVNGNGAIDSGDKALRSIRYTDRIRVY